MTRKPKFIMLVGLPGSGKSTYRANSKDAVVISTDDMIEEYAKLHNKTYSDVFQEATGTATIMSDQQLMDAVRANKDIVWDQTNLTVATRAKKLAKIPKNYEKIAVFITTSHEELLKRIASRPGKTIPDHVFQQMSRSIQAPTTSEGFDRVINIRT